MTRCTGGSTGGEDHPVIVDHRGEVRIVATTVLDGGPIALTVGCDETLRITDVTTGAACPPDGDLLVACRRDLLRVSR